MFPAAARSRFRVHTDIAAPIQRCFDLSRDLDLHLRSMRGSGERAVAGVTSGLIGPGESVTWEARHLGRTWRMTSTITAFDPPRAFTDESVSPPFESFRHEHLFAERRGITTMTDIVTVRLGFGWASLVAEAVVAVPYLRRLIVMRNREIKRAAEDGR